MACEVSDCVFVSFLLCSSSTICYGADLGSFRWVLNPTCPWTNPHLLPQIFSSEPKNQSIRFLPQVVEGWWWFWKFNGARDHGFDSCTYNSLIPWDFASQGPFGCTLAPCVSFASFLMHTRSNITSCHPYAFGRKSVVSVAGSHKNFESHFGFGISCTSRVSGFNHKLGVTIVKIFRNGSQMLCMPLLGRFPFMGGTAVIVGSEFPSILAIGRGSQPCWV